MLVASRNEAGASIRRKAGSRAIFLPLGAALIEIMDRARQ
jgi:hypothetical protein